MHRLFVAATEPSSTVLNLALVSGIAAFGVYCASHAVRVWRARNRTAPAVVVSEPAPHRLRRAACRASLLVIALGLLLLAIGYVSGAAARRQGVLAGHGLFTPRLPDGLEAAEVTGRDTVAAGEVVARFRSPKRQAEVEALKHRLAMLAAERTMALHAPPEPDPELVRRRQELSVERRHLEYSYDQFAPARDLVVRERMRDRLAKEAQVRALATDLDRLRREQEQAAARLRLRQERVARAEKLSPTRAAPGEELAERQTELAFQTAEVAKLERQIANTEAEAARLKDDLVALDALTGEQAAAFTEQVQRVRERLAAVPAGEAPLEEEWAADAERAKARRAAALEKLDADSARCEAELAGLAGSLTVTAPFAGRVAWRDPSPGAASGDAPLLVLAPESNPAAGAFRLKLRMTGREARALEGAGETTLAVAVDGIELRFPGRLAARRPLPHDGGHVLAELSCDAPPEAARDLAAGKTVSARLMWSPPVYASPLFPAAAALVALGSAGWLAAARAGRRGESTPDETANPPLAATPRRKRDGHAHAGSNGHANGNGHAGGNGHVFAVVSAD